MTTALGIAAVTATLRDLISDGLVEHNLNGLLGASVNVTALPPDRVMPEGSAEPSRLNLFLHRVSPNSGWRNEGLPSRDASGRNRLSNAPLAIDLHFLLAAYGASELHAETLLGYAMQWLHETPVLTRDAIRAALTPPVLPGTSFERALADSGLADQIEMVKITPEYLDGEEISKLWTAAQTHLRPTAAYKATVLLIQAQEPTRSALPVLTRGLPIPGTERDEGIHVTPFLEAALPTLETVEPASGQLVVRLGENTDLSGHHLDGASCSVLLGNDRFNIEQSLTASSNEPGKVRFMIPVAEEADYPVGLYRVGVSVVPPGESKARESNRLALTVAPQITGLPMNVARDMAGTASFTIDFHPALREGQRAVLVLGQQEYEPELYTAPVTSLDFVIEKAPPEAAPGHLVRLRIDGIDSPIIDRTAKPPKFLDQRIVIT